MASVLAHTIAPDAVISFEINPGTLLVSGKHKGAYQPQPRSRAFPFLTSAEVLERFDDPEADDIAFHENCRAWARRVLVPRRRAGNGGV
jgi:hypothetical protein